MVKGFLEDPLDPQPALIIPSPALFIPLPDKVFPNKLAPNVPNNTLKNAPFCSFASFEIFH